MQIIIKTVDNRTKVTLPKFQKEQQKAFLDVCKELVKLKIEFIIKYN